MLHHVRNEQVAIFFFSSRRRHTRCSRDWSSDVCSSDLVVHTRPDDEEVSTVWRNGLPLSAPARTLVDVLDDLQPEQASMAVQQALSRGLLTTRQLKREAARRHKERAVEAILSAGADRGETR